MELSGWEEYKIRIWEEKDCWIHERGKVIFYETFYWFFSITVHLFVSKT